MTANTVIQAKELTGEHIGQGVRYLEHDKNSKVDLIVTGELRTVTHHDDVVRVILGEKRSSSDGRSGILRPTQRVVINPTTTAVDNISELRRL